ncbi:VPS41 Vacuolar protein sorting-associated protein 41 [Candida maltosa Xu316]|uniref:Vacuolar protein sorting-associated protein 41 n=1 Tax=Candida maltosa (strain Xu316) TaxID=1245528 RepID=M3ISV5_CANMX|nr:Vacuolar protein sorting-associated protein, putative (Vacuolar protein sorting protein, putative) [Candida maltosa Xu316]
MTESIPESESISKDIDHETSSIKQVDSPQDSELNNDTTIEEEDESSEEESEDEDEDTEPPKLKYTRMNKLPANFFTKDPISTCTFHESIFIFATHSGIVHLCKPNFETIRTFKAHRASILSVYTDGVFFATASMDGTVVIGSISDEKDILAFDFGRPVHAVILDRNYSKTRSFISGGMAGQVIYSSKGWLGKRSDVILDQDNGPIVGIELIDDLVIWMNDKGISIFHLAARQVISVLEKPEDSPRSDLYWPRVAFPDTDRVIIAWSNYIWSLRVSIKTAEDAKDTTPTSSGMSRILPSTASISFRAVQEKKVEVEHTFKLDSLVSGIASFKDDLWMVLTYNAPEIDEETGKKTFFNPDLKLINSTTGEVELEEELGLKDINNLGLNDFVLGTHIETIPKYFIVSARDGVVAEEFQLDDCLSWYLEKENYLQAWEISQHLVTPIKRLSYGIEYVDSLIKDDEWNKAADFLKNLLPVSTTDHSDIKSLALSSVGSNQEDMEKEILNYWETWSNIFIHSNHIPELTEIIPTKLGALPVSIYTKILKYWIIEDQRKLHDLIEVWDTGLYDLNEIELELESRATETETIERSLVTLYDKSLNPAKAVPHLIHLEDPEIIQYLAENHILVNFVSQLPTMISLMFKSGDLEKSLISELEPKLDNVVSILVDHRLEISPQEIVNFLNEASLSFVSFFYLEKLSQIDDFLMTGFGDERVKLYAEYKREKLLPYLTKNDDYDIDRAITICENNEYTKELVYLLGKIGKNKEALALVVNKLEDPKMAIEFAKHQNDKETWAILLDQSMSKPAFIKALIENSDESSNAFYDPITILQRMPSNFKIEGLNESIVEFSKHNDLNILLNEIILKIIYKQSEESSQDNKRQKLRGFEVNVDTSLREIIQHFETIIAFISNNTPNGETKVLDLKLESEITDDYSTIPYENMAQKLAHIQELQEKCL